MTEKAVVLFSGGQDSTTCLAWAIERFGVEHVLPVSFDYGQRHIVELDCAERITDLLGVPDPVVLPVEALRVLGGAALTSETEVEAVASKYSGNQFAYKHNLPSTFVPGRNLLFLTLAAAFGAKHGVYNLVTGVCEADAAGYPDCRESFINAAEQAISEALDDSVTIHAPLLTLNKAKTWGLADGLGVLELVRDETHTCYYGNHEDLHDFGYGCGECPACLERAHGYRTYFGATNEA